MPSQNQLFKINPDQNIINLLLGIFGLDDLNDSRFFTKKNMIDLDIVQQMNDNHATFHKYYLPCKGKIYLNNLNEKKCITILRQFLKPFYYKCIAIEKSSDGKKYMTYRLIYNNSQLSPTTDNNKREYIVNFDM
jgi:hypothetical protein